MVSIPDFASPHGLVWIVVIFVIVLAPAYLFWSNGTSGTQGYLSSQVTAALEPADSRSRDEQPSTAETKVTFPGDGNDSVLEATLSQEKGSKPHRDDPKPAANASKIALARTDYTVGWICAIPPEDVAARVFLDEEHEPPDSVPDSDDNTYTLGRVGGHNVVITVLPNEEYGIGSAASVAKDLSHSFPNIRIGLMVGVGGGAPSKKHDIRLGDVVVSARGNGHGGVFQYDYGKMVQGEPFHPTGSLNQPPRLLLSAVGLATEYEIHGHSIEKTISAILKDKPRLRQMYGRPLASTDRLYRADIPHPPDNASSCATCCGNDPSHLIPRHERTMDEDNPAIHYGLIASANCVQKDAFFRDKLSAEMGVLCFEMEAAGLMNQFPCLVIRDICDYSDSHKNKDWQGYAAMAAAAYAKDLLGRISQTCVKAEPTIGDILSKLSDTATEQLSVTKQILQVVEDNAKAGLSEKLKMCHQLFLLTSDGSDTTYEWYKDRVDERVDGTCLWFLKHKHFQTWLEQDSGPLLVSADPGCGKSVLAKYLIDDYLPRQSATICYFFFKDQDQNTTRQALCALLHQLFTHQHSLLRHATVQFDKYGPRLINSIPSLWTILGNAIKDPQARPIILVLDALDECAEPDFRNLVRHVKSLLSSDQIGHGKLKCLLTCRPYKQIVSKFRDRSLLAAFANIHIPGEEESETISQEVNCVIMHRVDHLSADVSRDIKDRLAQKLRETTHRTYLWISLVFDDLEKEDFVMTPSEVESAIATLPRNINEAYERILSKSKDDPMVRKALSAVLVTDL